MKVRVFIMTFAGVAGFMPLQASEEIVVTNERRVQTAMSVPLSVDVLSRATGKCALWLKCLTWLDKF